MKVKTHQQIRIEIENKESDRKKIPEDILLIVDQDELIYLAELFELFKPRSNPAR